VELEDINPEPVKIAISRNKAVFVLVLSVVFYLAAVLLWGRQGLDSAFVIKQNFILDNALYSQAAKLISRYGMGVISLSLAVLLFITRSNSRHKVNQPVFLYIIISFALASIAGDVLKEILDRARPAVELSGQILQTEVSSSPSFPSGHATKSMALALPFLLMASNTGTVTKIVKIVTLLMALLVCYARIALQKHFLSDVLAGVGTALFFLLIAVWVVNYFFRVRNIDEKKLFLMNGKIRIVFLALAVVLCMI
jgi:undecaprenyl-diphosphatase